MATPVWILLPLNNFLMKIKNLYEQNVPSEGVN